MRTVKLVWTEALTPTTNYALETEILIEDDEDPRQAGRDALHFVEEFRAGLAEGGTE